MKNDFREVIKRIARHGKIMLRGIVKVVYGAVVVGMICAAVYGFTVIPAEGGYAAVLDFTTAAAILIAALVAVYSAGGGKRKKGGFEK